MAISPGSLPSHGNLGINKRTIPTAVRPKPIMIRVFPIPEKRLIIQAMAKRYVGKAGVTMSGSLPEISICCGFKFGDWDLLTSRFCTAGDYFSSSF